ncbi:MULTISPECIES: Crp/Fnr family transcriptional regulator [Prevotella]|jgi:CRP-like cAMP-binding protein|uniref:Crp/Fnr family transcriptional regulator n=1 Tax=Prevotella TaxID=838 RepID=UPI0005B71D02|nr:MULTISPECIES: Crp/Fnr family transcriptional regulator [Prevotella]KIP54864.1 cyclic nucleotide-binding protein [Prevotella pectinovora]KIP55675.1 cyclic nucleotide-binding protein [Prevotella pectinovora]KIP56689.1 cyclic nucleotide-binding protein [Prevotella pectinovora]KIP60762.1 cyclic nucleotide-binding protein [Prevotella pectinovora]MDD7743382.1 Crp/Fnr family transcriptional regulator [Prevotella pectinovora]
MKEPTLTKRDIARELARRYSTMAHDELDILESILVPMKFARGEKVVESGDVSDAIYYVERGMVREFYFKNNKSVTEYLAADGTIVMSIESLFREEPSKLVIEALEPTIVYALPKKRLEEVALHNVNIQILYRKILEESLIISQRRADLLRFESAKDRYLKLCKLNPKVIMKAPLVYVASYLQMTPETLSRVRSAVAME